MKNIYIIPTDKPSRLAIEDKELILVNNIGNYRNAQNIYITNSEEIKEGEYCITKTNEIIRFKKSYTQGFLYKKIILTTDQSLIQDDVQAINDEFLEWFVKNPSCEEVEVINFHTYFTQDVGNKGFYKIIIPKEELHSMDDEVECNNCGNLMSLLEDESNYACFNSECTRCYEEYEKEPKQECKGSFKDCFKPLDECVCDNMKQETLKDVAERLKGKELFKESNDRARKTLSEIKSLPKQERSYSEEEVLKLVSDWNYYQSYDDTKTRVKFKEWFEQNKKK